ncbi:MAG: hypothetical protein EAZ97_00120, partial [Bacteroidetes bacterium]
MGIQDFLVTPLYIIFIYLIAFFFRRKFSNVITRNYYFTALHFKVIGAIFVGIIYKIVYKGEGDTYLYYQLGGFLARSFYEQGIVTAYRVLTTTIADVNLNDWGIVNYARFVEFFYMKDEPSYLIVRLAGIGHIFSFGTYSVIALFFACYSFIGSWAMFMAFYDLYPKMVGKMAISVFFLPSVFFWGSGLLKDSLTFGGVGMALCGFYFGIIKGRNRLANLSLMAIGVYTIFFIKLYILYCLIPSFAMWLYLHFGSRIKARFIRILLTPFLIILVSVGGYFLVIRLTEKSDYSVDKIANKAQVTSNYLRRISNEGGSYYLGEFDGTITGLLKYFPQAVAVSLFRPFIWEAGFNPVRQLAAFEASFFIYITFFLFRNVSLKKIAQTIYKEPLVLVGLAFAITFSFAVGVTTANFGSLVRYKIVMMPFYISSIFIILEINGVKKALFPFLEKRKSKTQVFGKMG